MKEFLKSKIHRATVTGANLNYIGSITIDKDLCEKVGLDENEKVLVANLENGERIETYVVFGEKGKGEIILNGAAAHKFKKGDKIIIFAFELSDSPVKPKIILVDENNKFEKFL
jgi:aspartate 1-decarboxylase